MSRKPTRAASPRKQPAAVQTSESIAEQTKLFLKSGNKIDVVDSGISGQPVLGARKQIDLRGSRKA
ncbi:hypothetical protein [Pseudohalioglobus lutimaris]|uniref:Transcriptional regulator SutA RNAP-binding domain-containing protein n=1 Tax=Pseudohalioglobus lutimaris TaxID=1737061 RepID=A0A2N5X8B9_9GAMM|nr:hypothetical protein [Pseudohalioglobus lutimaris]PLW70726.1 hypothetical protein C0039_00920 [Pseudohalioglobus lutimaris]